MVRNRVTFLTLLAAGLVAYPAMATITVSMLPTTQSVNITDGTTTVDIVADIPAADAIITWGLDVIQTGTSVSLASVMINDTLFDAAPSLDGDGLSALVPFADPAVSGMVTLATLTYNLDAEGVTVLNMADDNPTDLTEGFALEFTGFADVQYETATIEVVPEPASLALLAIGGLCLIRRR